MIQLNRVSKMYKKVIGVNDLTIDLAGGAYGLVGPNGSGKTTLINLLTGQLRPTLGSVRVLDQNPWGNREVLRRIGLCPATDVLYPNVSARQWVRYLVRLHGFDAAESARLTDIALDRVGLTDAMDRPMGSYSLGMRQRAKLAQAIAHEPEFLILDEPYNGLDPVGRFAITKLLKQWTDEGRSLLFASHVLHEIEAITPSFLLIHGGRLLASGTASEVETIVATQPQEVSLLGDDLSKLVPRLVDAPWVDSLRMLDNRRELRIALRDPRELYSRLPHWIVQDGLSVREFKSADGNLTALFDSLLKRHRGETV